MNTLLIPLLNVFCFVVVPVLFLILFCSSTVPALVSVSAIVSGLYF